MFRRSYHAGSNDRRGGISKREADASHACFMEHVQLGVCDGWVQHGNAPTGILSKLIYCVDRGSIVGGIIAWRHDNRTRGADPLLQKSVFRFCARSEPRVRRVWPQVRAGLGVRSRVHAAIDLAAQRPRAGSESHADVHGHQHELHAFRRDASSCSAKATVERSLIKRPAASKPYPVVRHL